MPFIDIATLRRVACRALALLTLGLVACAPTRPPGPTAPPAAPPAVSPGAAGPIGVPPPSAGRARNWDEYKVQVAHRLVAANPNGTYLGEVPEPLLAIPVLEIELNGDGSVNRISVLREPRQAKDTVQLAIDAVRRAAPFDPLLHLPRPWKFSEVFLFNDDRRFKPRILDR